MWRSLIVRSTVFFFQLFSIDLCPFTACPRVISLAAPETAGRRVPLCVHDYLAFRTVQAALQTATAVVGSHELVSCSNGGRNYMLYE